MDFDVANDYNDDDYQYGETTIHELHPIVVRTLSWFSRSTNSTGNNTNWHISDWWHNNTFDYEEFNEDVQDVTSDLENNLHPATDVDVNGVLSSTIFNSFVFLVFVLTYELLRRHFPYVYATRQSRKAVYDSLQKREREGPEGYHSNGNTSGSNDRKRPQALQTSRQPSSENLPDLYQFNTPLEWVKPVFGIPWRQVREEGGLDAYFFLRYIRMCVRITSVSALWGMIILFPMFAHGENDAVGWYHYSMANVKQGSSLIWVPTLFMYLFSCFVFFIMKHEYKHYVELRMDFLGKGGGSNDQQHQYSVMVEQIPSKYRSEEELFNYFEQMFPNRVHSSNVLLKIPEVEGLSKKKLRVTARLEKSIAYFEATEKRPWHVVGRPRIMLLGIELITLDWICCGFNKKIIDNFDDVDPDKITSELKGEKVDSINYYTYQLKNLNKKMFLLQKENREVAELGIQNRNLMASSWDSDYADYFMDDPNVEESSDDDDEVHHMDIQWQESALTNPIDVSKNLSTQVSEMTMGTEFQNRNAAGESSTLDHLSLNMDGTEPKPSMQESYPGKKTWMIPDTNFHNSEDEDIPSLNQKPKSTPLSPSSIYGSLAATEAESPRRNRIATKSKRTVRFFRSPKKKNNGEIEPKSSKEEPLISHPSNVPIERAGMLIRKRNKAIIAQSPAGVQTSNYESCATCLPSEKTTKKLSKFAGRFGLDFGAYATKLLHRFLSKVFKEEKEKKFSKTGFVTFSDLGSVTCVASAPLTAKPNTLDVSVAPEARDLIWDNCHYSTGLTQRRQHYANFILAIGALIWSIPVAFIQGVSSAENVAQLPGMEWILEYDNGNLRGFINAYLPVVALLGLILILPIIFERVARSYEKRKTLSDIQRSIVGRYFYYQLANIYISVTAGSLWKSAADILARPSAGLEILGNSLPTVVGYFIALIITKILGGLPLVILRLGALSRYLLLRLITQEPFLTQRELDQVYRAEPLLYGWEYPTQLLVIVICFTYACISPIILIFGALYFVGALMVYKKQVMYVYSPPYESGGSLFPLVCDRTIVGLICGQLTFIGYSIIRGGHYQPLALVPLVYFSLWTMRYFRIHFAEPSKRLTLERAMELDAHTKKVMERIDSPSKRKSQGIRIPEDNFKHEHYKQPVLTEKHSEPRFYRIGEIDPLTVEAREKLSSGTRSDLWYGDMETRSEMRMKEDGMVV